MANFVSVEEANTAYDELANKLSEEQAKYKELNDKYVKLYEKVFFEDKPTPKDDDFDKFCEERFK